jgi:ribosomal-protein-alanine N-acetyltransferase
MAFTADHRRGSSHLRAASVTIRSCLPGDLRAIVALQRRCPPAAQWQESDYAELIAQPEGMLLVAAAAHSYEELEQPSDNGQPGREILLPSRERLLGFCAARRVFDEALIRNLAIDPGHRRKGIARALLEQSHRRLRAAGAVHIYLEVRPSNTAARNLYFGFGYRTQSVRRDYYREPAEDAEIMSLELGPEE